MKTAHVWWHTRDSDVDLNVQTATYDGSVYEVSREVLAATESHGHEVTDVRITRDMDGWLVGLDCTVLIETSDGLSGVMRHRFMRPSEEWPRKTLPAEAKP